MPTITVDAYDLKAAISLLHVYMGLEKPAGHFKDPGRKLPDTYYLVRVGNLKKALEDQRFKMDE